MSQGYTYTGVREGNSWRFTRPAFFQFGSNMFEFQWETAASLSEVGLSKLLEAFPGGGLNVKELWLSRVVGDLLNSFTTGLVRVFEIPDETVTQYLNA